jgi:type III secretion system FlhB-like substrate exporter
LLIVGGVQAAQRRTDVVSYDRRVAAARRVVAAGMPAGHRVFDIMSGVKDLDLAVKEDPALAGAAGEVLVLTDVPASFVVLPPALAQAAAPLLARPPLPPSGAYRFGDARVVGLARREDEPTLREVLDRFPDMRFVRLRPVPSGQIIARDVTDETRQVLDVGGEGEQD